MHFFFTSVGVHWIYSLCASCDENKLFLYKCMMTYDLVQKETASSTPRWSAASSSPRCPVFTGHLLCAGPHVKILDSLVPEGRKSSSRNWLFP